MGENKVKQMTAQEAIDIIQSIPLSVWDVMSKSEDEAIDMAFGALEKQAEIERILEQIKQQIKQQIEEHKNIVTEYDEYNKGKLEAYEHSLELVKNCFNTEQ